MNYTGGKSPSVPVQKAHLHLNSRSDRPTLERLTTLPLLNTRSPPHGSPKLPPTHYSPSLRKRRGSLLALQSLDKTQKNSVTSIHAYYYPKRKMSFVKAHYYPFLFALMTLSAMAELGLTAFLVSAGNENGTWPSPKYHSLLILFIFNAAWTTLFSSTYMLWMVDGSTHFLANIASSVMWLLITSVLWGTAAGIMHDTRTGGNCSGFKTISRCRQSLTVEAIGWTEFGLCVLTMIATCLWIQTNRLRRIGSDAVSTSDSQRLV